MSMETVESLPGLTEANAELDRLMAADAAEDQAAGTPAGESATAEGERAAQATEVKNAPGQSKPKTETPSTVEQDKSKTPEAIAAEKAAADKAAADKAAADKTAGKGEPSRYAKNQERLKGTWAQVNAEKDALKREREDLERQRQEFQTEREQAEQQFSPEAYETAAQKFEKEGKFDLAELAKKKAEELRKNPPKPGERAKAAQARTEAQRKEWALKAGVDFPDVAKDNSPLQVRVAQLLQEEPDLKAHPKGIYMAARLASLEATAASVPDLKAKLAQAEAKVKEFEELTAPGGEGAATRAAGEKTFEQKSEEEQFAELTQQAIAHGSLV
ncbi:MAG TPA: hypothetical protein VHA37_04505 [Candidatus Saccharimonadales bacterium]|nr:hypothetical protein [Candidatus Saccharimonadales bacterium]